MIESCLLLWLVALPAFGGLICLVLPDRISKMWAMFVSLVGVVLGALLYCQFDGSKSAEMQMVFSVPWIPTYKINFALGVDGISFSLVLLTKLMMPIALLASWGETRKTRAFMFCFLLLDTAMTGTFLVTDIFSFYVFWELMLIPMILLIGIWGSTDRVYAALKFFIYTFAGSLLMLVAIFYLFNTYQNQTGQMSANISSFYHLAFAKDPVFFSLTTPDLIFLAFAVAFCIKVPLFPLHTWLPDAHVQAPTGGSILLAAVMLKMGIYGLLRFAIPIAPESFQRFTPLLVVLSLSGLLYGAWVAFQQTDMKKLVAYSSVSHLGLVVLGLCASNGEGITGAMFQSVGHGLSTGGLFLLVGMLYERRHSRNFADFGGLAEVLPWFAFFLVFISAASMAVPGLNGFIGEFLILIGAFKANHWWGAFGTLGIIFGAVYMLFMIRKVLFGTAPSAENRMLKDMNGRDWVAILPLCAFIVLLGVAPNYLLSKVDKSWDGYWSTIQNPAKAPVQQSSIPKGQKAS